MNKFINTIHQGECVKVLELVEKSSIDLAYLDPPFFTEKKHALKTRDRSQEFCFDDIWGSDTEYSTFLFECIYKVKSVLKKTASIFVHCDNNANHIVRTVLDEIFGKNNFRSEIIWHYKRWSNSKKGLMSSHQNIYFYTVSDDFIFNPIYTPYSETTNIDQILQNRTRDEHNKTVYEFEESGKFKNGKQKRGVPLNDVWEIPYLNPKAKERVGYPTQKPLLLLERIIELVTHKGAIVLDPFCGSGTTCVAAKLLGRKYIGIDKLQEAVDLTCQRLLNPIKTESNLLKAGRESYISADQHALGLLSGIPFNPVHRNKCIDAILVQQFEDTPILVRVQRSHETLSEASLLLLKAKKKKQAKKVILIQTHTNDLFNELEADEGIIILQSPSVQIASALFPTK